ncbi:MAG: TerC family protein [Cytophagaceae bacterium]|nr:TerC family protein [Cytophagaceae bacterium]
MGILFWFLFNLFVITMLVLDLFVLNKKTHVVKVKEALWWSAFWVGLAVIFNIGIYFWHPRGSEAAIEFLTGYLIEESLSVDNLFVFMLIFNYFRVPPQYQRKVLFWGIIGALVLRAIFILIGVSLIHKFAWTIYILGAFLVFTGIKMVISKDKEINPQKNPIIKIINKIIPVTRQYHEDKFFVRIRNMYFATPLFIVVLVVETTDVIFALDSIPAILAVTDDAFIVYTSNVFALLGLRSLYFALAGIMQLFHYIHYGLALILSFIGVKLLPSHEYHDLIDMKVALLVVAGILAGSILLSILFPQKKSPLPEIPAADAEEKSTPNNDQVSQN